ncbi:MAG: hypothetical protein WAQ33_09570 [Gaiellaceae bacterium]
MLEARILAREYGSPGTLKPVEALWGPLVTKPNPADVEDWYKISVFPNLMETLGVYVSDGLISEELVYKLWGGAIVSAWQQWANPIYRLRILSKTQEVWVYFEYLNARMAALLEADRAGRGSLRPSGP